MLSRSQLRLLSILALVFAIAQASWLDANIYGREIVARQESGTSAPTAQATGTGSGPGSAASSSSSVESESTPTPSATPSSSSSTSESSTPPPSSSSTSASTTPPPSTSSTPTTQTQSSTSASSTPSRTSSSSSTSTEKENTKTTSSVTPTKTTAVVVSTVVTTRLDGSVVSSVTSSTVTSTLPTGTAALNNDGTSSSSGMSSKTRNTIIGVVVGVGGAIILVGLGIVAFRIWGRRKSTDESDGLMGFGGGSPGHEKTGSGSVSAAGASNPFQSTLENYHNPARNGNVNASSNF